jgi:hypothetical protein
MSGGFLAAWLMACSEEPEPPVVVEDSDPVEVPEPSPALLVSEVMARGVAAPWAADWIELTNPGPEDVALDGWSVSDGGARFALRALTVPAGGALVLWADGRPALGPDHLGFELSGDGEAVGLYDPAGVAVDGVRFGPQADGVALARRADGGWSLVDAGTPGVPDGVGAAPVGEGWPSSGPACGRVDDLASPWFSEGDEVSVSVGCAGSSLTPVRSPDGATVSAGGLLWRPGPAEGGRYDVVYAATPLGDERAVPTAAGFTLWVADNPELPRAVPVTPRDYVEEWGLPVVHVETSGPLTQADAPCRVTFGGQMYDAEIKIRGASSAGYPKPSYTLEFTDQELPIPAWGVTRDHLILLTTFDDNAYVRQKLVYDLWAAMASFWGEDRLTPRTFFTVVYLDGAYHGLYVGLDRIDDEFMDQMGLPRESALYKAVDHDASFYSEGKWSLHQGYTKEEGLPEDDYSDLDALVAFTGGASASALVDGADAWFVLEEFMDWFLLVHYAMAEDSAGKNAYLAHPPGGVFRYAPWDFNHAWGQGWYTYRIDADDLNDFQGANRVFWAIQTDPDAEAALWDRFRALRATGPLDPAWLRDTVEGYWAAIEPSAARDWAKWRSDYRSYGGWAGARGGDWTEYGGEKAYVRAWLEDRAALFEALHP